MNNVISILGKAFYLVALAGLSLPAFAQDDVNTGYFGNVAIKGYDPVSYFTPGAAERGSEEHALEWLGAAWHFVSEEHREAFEADPVRYAPQYGGYCAVGMAENTLTRDIDPEAFTIINGKLYLNYSKEVGALLGEGLVEAADSNWEALQEDAE